MSAYLINSFVIHYYCNCMLYADNIILILILMFTVIGTPSFPRIQNTIHSGNLTRSIRPDVIALEAIYARAMTAN